MVEKGKVEEGAVEVANVFGELEAVVAFSDRQYVLVLGEFEVVFEWDVVFDFLEGLLEFLGVGEGVVYFEA